MQLTKTKLDRDQRRELILDVAQSVFLEEGFANASMSTIAARLGGSKGTLYNYFKSKDELFNAYVERRCLWQDEIFAAPLENETPEQTLRRIAAAYLTRVLTDFNLKNFRLIAAEAERSPEIGRTFYDAGPRKGVERVAELLEGMAKEGHLDLGDPEEAAHAFLGLTQNRYFKARLCNAIPELTRRQVEDQAALAARTFLRAFGKRG
ncbi:MAG TPA: TetR/AcrR family transcriptional regulator [Phenylobacterium sp.]|jgi:AcrR family transcriptional regulator|uniref:TetR/AcrR family transcriptional regulator n=1 Tax=Phenylobacterium sp. TaxID=1871053 RepID=UPI002C4012D1|nr:TetR/AcrR family transcriptional regulator [Phenylobacterium sp.]HXA38915.1 TetR/AcrR family transcriptional regulator [Phenylobacterium sp.]